MLIHIYLLQAQLAEAKASQSKNRIRNQIADYDAQFETSKETIRKIDQAKVEVVEAFELQQNMKAASIRIQVLWRSRIARRCCTAVQLYSCTKFTFFF